MMSAEDAAMTGEADPQVTFKVKTSAEGNHSVTMAESATVADLKALLSSDAYEKVPADRQRLIYSGKVMKDEHQLSIYKIKAGNTIHMVKSAQSNAAQNPAQAAGASAGPGPRAAPGVPTNMAAGTANDPLAGLTGARYAGHVGLPGAGMFGPDGGMGPPPGEEEIARMLSDPNMQQMMNEALSNPAMVDMMIQQNPMLRNNPQARQIINSPEFRQMMTNPEAIRQAAAMRRMMGGFGGGAGGSFPAPGNVDNTPDSAAGNAPNAAANPSFPGFGGLGAAGGANPFAALFPAPPGETPSQTPPAPGSAGQVGSPGTNTDNAAANPFASLFGGGGAGGAGAGTNPFQIPGMPPMTPEMMQQAMQMLQSGGFGDMFGGAGAGGLGAGLGGSSSPPPPADTRPPEERYESQLRQLNDMGFFDFDRNVNALRRSGGSVQGAIEHLLSG